GGAAQTGTPAAPAAPETLPATVLASRLRRGQWEVEVELDPERLAALEEPDGSTGSAEPSGVGADATAESEPARATALTRSPHASGARVTLSLDPARTARL
ncbi:MAG: ABC transporter ATP-binding protein, partial [Actinomyces oris]